MTKLKTSILLLSYLAFSLFMISCDSTNENSTGTDVMKIDAFSQPQPMVGLFVLGLEKAHNATEYRKHDNVRFDLNASFGRLENVHATITMSTKVKDVKIDKEDGTYLVYQESTTSFNEDSIMHNFERFKHFAWAHFFSLPKRLRNENVRVEKFEGSNKLGDESFKVRRIRLEPRPGHEDIFEWYVVYADRGTGLLRYAGYSMPDQITDSKNIESHIVEYSDYQMVEGVPIAHCWTFYEWNLEEGIGEMLGEAELSDISFVDVEESFYK